MTNSTGYRVRLRRFPAVPVTEADIEAAFADVADKVQVTSVKVDNPVRRGVGHGGSRSGFAREITAE